ncbi:MAG: AraC family transcriptional regulator [Bacteroidota bacterium]
MSLLVTSKDLFQQSAFPIVASSIVDRPMLQKEFHRHEYYEMLYLASGSLLNELSTKPMEMQPGDLVIIKPYVRHVLRTHSDKDKVCAYSCSFLPQVVDSRIDCLEDVRSSKSPNRHYFAPFLSLADDDASAILMRVASENTETVEKLFQSVLDASQSESASAAARRRYCFLELLATLSDFFTADLNGSNVEDTVVKIATSRYHAGLRKALNYIHNNLEETISLKEVAKMSGVSVSYFSILMKQATGMSFVAYLNSLRMDCACSLLRNTSLNLMDICYQSGFNDYSHFSRNFKKVTGLSPKKYRQRSVN